MILHNTEHGIKKKDYESYDTSLSNYDIWGQYASLLDLYTPLCQSKWTKTKVNKFWTEYVNFKHKIFEQPIMTDEECRNEFVKLNRSYTELIQTLDPKTFPPDIWKDYVSPFLMALRGMMGLLARKVFASPDSYQKHYERFFTSERTKIGEQILLVQNKSKSSDKQGVLDKLEEAMKPPSPGNI